MTQTQRRRGLGEGPAFSYGFVDALYHLKSQHGARPPVTLPGGGGEHKPSCTPLDVSGDVLAIDARGCRPPCLLKRQCRAALKMSPQAERWSQGSV